MKSRCRQLGISRWPYRKVKKVDSVIKALVDQKTVLRPQEAVQKCYLQNALEIRNHILSNPNSTAHLQIKKKKTAPSFSDDSASDTNSEQIIQEHAEDALQPELKPTEGGAQDMRRAEIISASLPKDQNVKETAKAASNTMQNWADKSLVQSLPLPVQIPTCQAALYPQTPLVWPQFPAVKLVNNPCKTSVKQPLGGNPTKVYQNQVAQNFGNLLTMYNMAYTQKALMQMQAFNAMQQQNSLSRCVARQVKVCK